MKTPRVQPKKTSRAQAKTSSAKPKNPRTKAQPKATTAKRTVKTPRAANKQSAVSHRAARRTVTHSSNGTAVRGQSQKHHSHTTDNRQAASQKANEQQMNDAPKFSLPVPESQNTFSFHKLAANVAYMMGTPWGFFSSLGIIVLWLCLGPVFGFSDTWQLLINTGTTIVTFLMVFLIQNTQNRDAKAINLKLDELIRAMRGANNGMIDIEDLSDDDLKRIALRYAKTRP
jgi:low affinity Fe/Cu permease